MLQDIVQAVGGGTLEFERIDFNAPNFGDFNIDIKGLPKSILLIEGTNVGLWAWVSAVSSTNVVLLTSSGGISSRIVGSTSGDQCLIKSIQNGKLGLHIWGNTQQTLNIYLIY